MSIVLYWCLHTIFFPWKCICMFSFPWISCLPFPSPSSPDLQGRYWLCSDLSTTSARWHVHTRPPCEYWPICHIVHFVCQGISLHSTSRVCYVGLICKLSLFYVCVCVSIWCVRNGFFFGESGLHFFFLTMSAWVSAFGLLQSMN